MVNTVVELREVTKRFSGDVVAVNEVSLAINEGEFFALLGPSGCGKTTTLRMIAGFDQPTSGEILIRGNEVQGVPAFHRPVNTVFQDYALFPHMTAIQNIAFGLEMQGVKRKEALERARTALDLVQLPQVADRKPSQMSGGQQQRVALARALVKEPAVLLLDEPLGALDLKLRKAMQFELKEMQRRLGLTFIFVTHDQEEAMTMADRIAVMSDGKVQQCGTPSEIYEMPANLFVADFIGETNLLLGSVVKKTTQEHHETLIDGQSVFIGNLCRVQVSEDTLIFASVVDKNIPLDSRISVVIRPERIEIAPIPTSTALPLPSETEQSNPGFFERLRGSRRKELEKFVQTQPVTPTTNIVEGQVVQKIYIGTDTRYMVEISGGQRMVVRMQNLTVSANTQLNVGDACVVFWDARNARVLSR
jgi:spermidine/putrescine transport system ATP-binding protein